jgi:hypothetical protein
VDGKLVFAHHGLAIDKAQSFEAQDFGDRVAGCVMADGSEELAKAARKTATKASKR